jgi:DNA replication and repair protein RecF
VSAAPAVRVERLALLTFRNVERLQIDLPAAGIAVIGDNGHGKTNLLEALYYLQLLRSFRGARDSAVTRFGASGFHVGATVANAPCNASGIAIGFERASRRKRVTLDGAAPQRLSDAYGAVPIVLCSPDDREIVGGAPSARRRYLDVMLSAVSHKYLFALQRYRAALLQRNAALRELGHGRGDESALAAWEPALAAHGAAVTSARLEWTAAMAAEFTRVCEAIGEAAPVLLEYVTRTDPADPRASLLSRLEETRAADIRRGLTHAGPHRDELRLWLGGREMRDFASAGQQRTAALALRMLEAVTMRDALGAHPLLLLDDPFAELDRARATRILGLLREVDPGQTFLCVPRADDIPPELSALERWAIQSGRLDRIA